MFFFFHFWSFASFDKTIRIIILLPAKVIHWRKTRCFSTNFGVWQMHRTESGLGMKLSTSICNIKKLKLKTFDFIRFEWTEITVGFTKRCLSGLGPVTTSLSYSVHPLSAGGREWTSYQLFKKGGLDRNSVFRGDCWEREGWLFSGGVAIFWQKIN